MKHIAIVIPVGGVLSGIEISRQIFTEVNDHLTGMGKQPAFHVQLVAVTDPVQLNDGLFTIKPDATTKTLGQTDLVIIPALYMDIKSNLEKNKELISWVTDQYHRGAEVASLCVGAFLLADTGLLKGKQCATHWKATHNFNDMFPDIKLVQHKIITDESGIYSSGGGISLLNLILYLVEKYAGREAALYAAKFFQIDISRRDQSPFIIFDAQKDHEDEPVRKIQQYIENNFQEKMNIDHLAAMVLLGRRSLERRFKKATSNTLSEYIQRVKIEAAKKHLETGNRTINDIMYEVGYADTKTFRSSFKMVTGLLPREYKSRYGKIV